MMRNTLFLLALLLLTACGDKLIEPPEDLIPKDQMVDILYEISIMDAIESNYPNALERNDIRVMQLVYRKYGVDSTRFAQSDLFYASRPQQYEAIYQELHDRLQAKRDSISKAIEDARNPDPPTEEPGGEEDA